MLRGDTMRGAEVMQESLLMLKRQEDVVQKARPARATRGLLNAALKRMDAGFEVARTLFGDRGSDRTGRRMPNNSGNNSLITLVLYPTIASSPLACETSSSTSIYQSGTVAAHQVFAAIYVFNSLIKAPTQLEGISIAVTRQNSHLCYKVINT